MVLWVFGAPDFFKMDDPENPDQEPFRIAFQTWLTDRIGATVSLPNRPPKKKKKKEEKKDRDEKQAPAGCCCGCCCFCRWWRSSAAPCTQSARA
jgi:hypothetical protein